MLSFFEVHEGFTVDANFMEEVDLGLDERAKAILDAAGEAYEDSPTWEKQMFFKKSDGWTRDMVQKMCDTFNGSAL